MTASERSLNGVLPIDKPAGPTSHDIVALARRALRTKRIGHTGTLDPFATGLLLLCIGPATRIAAHLTGSDKRYTATIRLGVTTDTDDSTGSVVDERALADIDRTTVERAIARQQGTRDQTPPAYSAKKKEGRRAYALARSGEAVELEPVRVTIHSIVMTRWDAPDADFEVHCSAGTYIRAIARDVGAELGVGGHLTHLRRTAIGAVSVDGALTPDEMQDAARVNATLINPLRALGDMTMVELSEAELTDVRHGRAIAGRAGVTGQVALAREGELCALANADAERIAPRKVFV